MSRNDSVLQSRWAGGKMDMAGIIRDDVLLEVESSYNVIPKVL